MDKISFKLRHIAIDVKDHTPVAKNSMERSHQAIMLGIVFTANQKNIFLFFNSVKRNCQLL